MQQRPHARTEKEGVRHTVRHRDGQKETKSKGPVSNEQTGQGTAMDERGFAEDAVRYDVVRAAVRARGTALVRVGSSVQDGEDLRN